MRHMILLACALVTLSTTARAQSTPEEPLADKILAQDKALFDAFNACDLATWKRHLAVDVEFYQDNDRVTTTREQLVPSFLDRCGPDGTATLRRELIPETFEVHPIQGYGAVQFGSHRFIVVGAGQPDRVVATPRFVHLWRNTGAGWEITRVISYGH